MKANKALKRLAKIEALISDMTERYSKGALYIRKALQDAKAAVARVKEAVSPSQAARRAPVKRKKAAAKPSKAKAAKKSAPIKKAAKKAAAKKAAPAPVRKNPATVRKAPASVQKTPPPVQVATQQVPMGK